MPSYKSFRAYIIVDGKPLDEYSTEKSTKDGLTTVTCWVPSVAGKQYQVQWEDTVFTGTSNGQVRIDGKRCGGRVIEKRNQVMIKEGLRISPTSSRLFEFALMKLTDDEDPFALDMPGNIGEIELRIQYWCKTGQAIREKISNPPEEQTYHEKSKKGIDHQTSFGTTVYNEKSPYKIFGEPIGKYFLRFVFRYRPLEVLRAHGIAPPAARTSQTNDLPQSSKRPRPSSMQDIRPGSPGIIELSDDDDDPQKEMEKLQRRLDELRAKHSDIRDRKRVKREPGVASIKTEQPKEPVFIDLTQRT
ncbi:hypothetical protein C8J55DRAFT_524573 [Lentinula edodes]|uniref:DUF7918 domain-containing protein n=1 Tax=Lentinula lateritia TaxID=40482 RepID=A0A9W9DGX8_9AGAR|nr:hypothetical protein C8J55DRAFT_524573 [Lentinula edodes]